MNKKLRFKRRFLDGAWYKAHPLPPQPLLAPCKPIFIRLLRVQTDYFTAGALWKGRSCVQAAPILRWMVGMQPGKVKLELLKMNATWEWLPRKSDSRLEPSPIPTEQPTTGALA